MKKKMTRLLALALLACLLLAVPAQAAQTKKEETATRGQFIQELYDTHKARYGFPGTADAVIWAKGMGVVRGYGDGSIHAEAALTRTQMAVMLHRYANRMWTLKWLQGDPLAGYDDADQVPAWAKNAIAWAVAGDLWFSGSATRLGFADTVTRAECETAVMALYAGGAPLGTEWTESDLVSLRMDSVANNKLEFTLRNTGDSWVFCGSDNGLYRKVNGGWYCVDRQNGTAADEHALSSGNERSYQQTTLDGALLDLPAGEYRVTKRVTTALTPHAPEVARTPVLLWAEFTIN